MYASILFAALLSTLWTLKVRGRVAVSMSTAVCALRVVGRVCARLQGGMYAVVYTDALQSIAMILGLVVCIAFAVARIDGGVEAGVGCVAEGGDSVWCEVGVGESAW